MPVTFCLLFLSLEFGHISTQFLNCFNSRANSSVCNLSFDIDFVLPLGLLYYSGLSKLLSLSLSQRSNILCTNVIRCFVNLVVHFPCIGLSHNPSPLREERILVMQPVGILLTNGAILKTQKEMGRRA